MWVTQSLAQQQEKDRSLLTCNASNQRPAPMLELGLKVSDLITLYL